MHRRYLTIPVLSGFPRSHFGAWGEKNRIKFHLQPHPLHSTQLCQPCHTKALTLYTTLSLLVFGLPYTLHNSVFLLADLPLHSTQLCPRFPRTTLTLYTTLSKFKCEFPYTLHNSVKRGHKNPLHSTQLCLIIL